MLSVQAPTVQALTVQALLPLRLSHRKHTNTAQLSRREQTNCRRFAPPGRGPRVIIWVAVGKYD
jgi:hypothetical protein